jgi:predicted transcriptional regulator
MGRIIKRWTDEEIATVRSMHAAGRPLYLIANKVGRTRRAVQHMITARKEVSPDAETDA